MEDQLGKVSRLHVTRDGEEFHRLSVDLLAAAGIREPEQRLREYPGLRGWHTGAHIGQPDVIHAPLPSVTSWKTADLLRHFTGHLHFSHTARLPSGVEQFAAVPGFEGGSRLIRLIRGVRFLPTF